jgi:hypothetical protein
MALGGCSKGSTHGSESTFFISLVNLLAPLVFTITPVFSQSQNKVVEWSKSPIGSQNETAAANLQLFRQIDGVES